MPGAKELTHDDKCLLVLDYLLYYEVPVANEYIMCGIYYQLKIDGWPLFSPQEILFDRGTFGTTIDWHFAVDRYSA